jgi:16S rRNA (cytosine967-C5)-methyltransferase
MASSESKASAQSLDIPGPQSSGLEARNVAWQVLLAVAAGAYADAALERQLARTPLGVADRALATELAYGAIRMRRLLDAWLDALGRVSAERQPPRLRWLLHIGLYQLLFCNRIPPAAAVNTSVSLAHRAGLGRLAGVVNGLMRALLRQRPDLVGDGAALPWQGLALPLEASQAFALRHSLPDWLAADLLGWLSPEAAERFARHCNTPPSLDLRVQPLRCNRSALLESFAAAGIGASALPDAPLGISLRQRPGDLKDLPGYAEGFWSVQDRHAMGIVPLLEAQPGMRILDACAAPGGKTTQIAELMAGSGELWAVDRSAARLERLERNASRLGLTGIHTLSADAADLVTLQPDWIGHFDRILVDAPCSGLGTLARHADARWRLQPETIEELAILQLTLLQSLLPLLAPGGRLVYATCTVHPRENSETVARLLNRVPRLKRRSEQLWWPGEGGDPGDGFYAAVLDLAPLSGSAGERESLAAG